MNKYTLALYRIRDGGPEVLVGRGEFWAECWDAAKQCALDAWWSWELDGDKPIFRVVDVEIAVRKEKNNAM